MFCFGKKILRNNVNKVNESTKNERKNIEKSNINYNHKIIHKNDSRTKPKIKISDINDN